MLELFRTKHTSFVWLTEAILLMAMLLVAGESEFFWESKPRLVRFCSEALLAVLLVQASIYYCGLYGDEHLGSPRRTLARFAKAIAAGGGLVLALDYVLGFSELKAGILVLGLLLSMVAIPLWRHAYQSISSSDHFVKRAIIVGQGELARDIGELIGKRCLGMQLVGMIGRPGASAGTEIIGTHDDLAHLVASERIDIVIVADSERRGSLPIEQLLALKLNGIDIREGTAFFEQLTGKVHVYSIKPSELFLRDGFDNRRLSRGIKRAFDILASSIALVLAMPIMAVTALAIRLESAGPILYRQIRVGERRREFSILKFRSMRPDAERDGARWASASDDRATRVGRFIRKTRIDELPQLWNVLRGDMSLVGPRPERPVFVDELEQRIPYFSQRLYVRPGVTGHAQVRCSYAASVEDSVEKLQYDLYYIKRFSLIFDFSILLDTIKVVLLRIGSR